MCDGGSGSLLSWGGGGGGISRVFFSFPLLGMGCGWWWTPKEEEVPTQTNSSEKTAQRATKIF